MSKTKQQYRDKIRKLLDDSHDRGEGPHGRTIYAVMQNVDRICSFITVRPLAHIRIRKAEDE